jgi:hypothetical protein
LSTIVVVPTDCVVLTVSSATGVVLKTHRKTL